MNAVNQICILIYDWRNILSDCIRGRRLGNQESLSMLCQDIDRYPVKEIEGVLEKFINPSEIKGKIDYSILNCNLDDESGNNNCWDCTKFIFPIGCMVGEDQNDL